MHEWFNHMGDFEPSSDCKTGDFVIWPNLLWWIIWGDMNSLGSNRDWTSFDLSFERVMVCPDFDVIGKNLVFRSEIVEKDILFSLVSVPPFINGFDEDVWVLFSYLSWFANSRRAVTPRVFKSINWYRFWIMQQEECDWVLSLCIVFNRKLTCSDKVFRT